MTGLVSFKSVGQLQADEKKKVEAAQAEKLDTSVESNLASHIQKVWETNRWAKQHVYQRLLACLRARKGVYSDEEKQLIMNMGGADPIYIKLTGTKSRAASAWIRDILLPVKERPWELQPTPIPELPDDIKESTFKSVIEQIKQMAQQEGMQLNSDQQMQFTDMVKEKVLDQLKMLSEIAIKNIELKIEDMMVDGEYKKAMEEFIEDFVTYPFACIKGPYYQTKIFLKWVNGKPTPSRETILSWRRVSPFDVFYSPHAKNIQDGDLIERLRFSRTQLANLAGLDGYNKEYIDAVIEKDKSVGMENWIWQNFERERLETSSVFLWSDKDAIDGLHYWGHVRGQLLLDWGYDKKKIDDPNKMYPIDAILIDKYVIRAVINDNPMEQRPYHSACWDAVPGSLIGIGLPEQMEDHQRMVNATARALATNMSVGSGPQVAILADMVAPGEDVTGIYPMKVWQFRSSLTGNSGKPVEFFQPDIKAQELLMVLNSFETKADDVTNVPRYSYGNEKIGGAGSTATGLSMLMNSAAKGIRRAIANIDLNIIQPTIYQTFVEVMMKDPDPTIRGDVKVVAIGSAAVLIKEQMHENLKEFMQITANPLDIEIMGKKGRAKLLTNVAEILGLDPLILPSDDELDQREQQERQQMEEQHQAELQQMQQQGQEQLQAQEQQLQQQGVQLQFKEQELEQQAMQLKQTQSQADQQSKTAQKQASAVESEANKLKVLQKSLEDQMAQMAAQKIQDDLDHKKRLAEIEQAQMQQQIKTEEALLTIKRAEMSLDAEADKLKAVASKTKLISATKADETKKEGTEAEKKESAAANAEVGKVIKGAMEQVAEALKLVSAPKKIDIQRDKEGKITGATAKPSSGGLKGD